MQQNTNFLFPYNTHEELILSDYLQQLAFEDFSGKIDLVSSQVIGQIFIELGRPIYAQVENLTGDEALLRLLSVSRTTLTATPTGELPSKNIENSLEDLLIEYGYRSQKIQRKSSLNTIKISSLLAKSNNFLLVHTPSGNDFEFQITKTEVTIGRAKNNLLCISENSIFVASSLDFSAVR